jgi:hypothetical protein
VAGVIVALAAVVAGVVYACMCVVKGGGDFLCPSVLWQVLQSAQPGQV